MNGIFRRDRFWLWGALALLIVVVTYFYELANAGTEPSEKGKQNDAVTLESAQDGAVKRVTLSKKAAERLGIETGAVSEATVVREQMVGGTVIPPVDGPTAQKAVSGSFAGFASAPAPQPAAPAQSAATAETTADVQPATSAEPKASGGSTSGLVLGSMSPATQPPAPSAQSAQNAQATVDVQPAASAELTPIDREVWIRVTLSPGEYERLAKDQPARIEQLQTREKLDRKLAAQPVTETPVEDMKRSMLTVHYALPGKDHGLGLNQRVRVGLPLLGGNGPETVVPYAAVYYDAQGVAWVYVTSQPLAFERQRVAVDRVVGDLAVLREGPPVGTKVVTVGASLLYGAEVFGK